MVSSAAIAVILVILSLFLLIQLSRQKMSLEPALPEGELTIIYFRVKDKPAAPSRLSTLWLQPNFYLGREPER